MESAMYILKFTHPLICRHIEKSNPVIRNISFLRRMLPRPVLLDKSNYDIIYEFSYIKHTSHVIRSKFWVPAMFTFVTPIGLLLSEIRFCTLAAFVASWLHSGFVHFISKKTVDLIGKIYKSKDNECDEIIISSIDVNGNRIDRCHKIKDVLVCDFASKTSYSMGFINVFIKDSGIMYQLNVRASKIHNPESFVALFGDRYIKKKIQEN